MKRNISALVVLLLIATTCTLANPIDATKAKSIAKAALTTLKNKQIDIIEADCESLSKSRIDADTTAPAFYIFNSTDSAGFVIVSGDDAFPSIAGYSDCGFVDTDRALPDGLALFLEAYTRYVEDVRQDRIEAPALMEDAAEHTVIVEPIVECQWGQDDPFNYYCPEAYPVGCVATAMAQIMYHYKWPETGSGSMSYVWNGRTLSEDFSTHTYDWSAMKKSAGSNRLGKARDAVARISYDCGVATKMSYGPGGSGTYDDLAMVAFYKYFGYTASTIDIVRRDCCNSKEEWERIIRKELDARRPIQFSAYSSTGEGGDAAGHSFIVDGYDSNGFVHVNWGWNGSGDGFYDMSLMDVDNYKFYLGQSAIIGITPNYEGKETKRNQFRLHITEGPVVNEGYAPSTTEKFSVRFSDVYNYSASTRVYYFGLGIFDKNGNFLDDVSVYSDKENKLPLQGFYGRIPYGPMTCKLPKTYPDGDYIFRAISKEDGYDKWVLTETEGGDSKNLLRAYIHSGKIHFYEVSTSIDDINASDSPVRTEYFDLNGRKITDPNERKGIVIRKDSFSDGRAKTSKLAM